MTVPLGKLESVKNRLKEYVEDALEGYTTNDWNFKIWNIDRDDLPLATIRLDPVTLVDENYGKKVPQDGCWATYEFSVHIHNEAYTGRRDGTVQFYKVMDDAEVLIDYLQGKSQNASEITNYQIYRIYDLRMEYSQPKRRARNMARMVVRGTILAKWLD